jgi:ribonucleotide reductase alpha subunit
MDLLNMLKFIIKRDGTTEEFKPNKLNRWSQWASKSLGDRVSWSDVVMEASKTSTDTIASQELQKRLIKACVEKEDWAHNLMAGRLYAALSHKELYEDNIPTVKQLFTKLYDVGLMKKLNYTDDEYNEIEKIIDHSRDFKLAYFQIDQIRKKYSLQNRQAKIQYETPQFTFMRMAMALAEDEVGETKLIDVKNYYDHFSFGRINAPTPNYVNLGTNHNGYASCCLYISGDSANSLAIGDHIAYKMTCMSAGIGGTINTRSMNDPVRNGIFAHQGKLPYYKSLAAAVNANLQAGRGGACTSYYSAFDPEASTIAILQNPKTTEDKKNRDIHFAVMMNRLFAKKVAANQNVFSFNTFTAPDLMQAFFSGDQDYFEELYAKYERDDSFVKNYTNARKLLILFTQQSYEVGTHYFAFIDEMNRHTPYKEPIYSSNLCVAPETLLLTKEYGEVEIATLKDQNVSVWNGKQWSETIVKKTGENQKLLRVIISGRIELNVTPYHKWFIIDEDDNIIIKTTDQLKHNDNIAPFSLPKKENEKATPPTLKYSICSVKDLNRISDTYCVSEPLEHKAVFNGVLTGNCTEITQPTAPYENMVDLYSTIDHGRGEVSMCSLAAIVEPNIHSDEEYASAAYYSLKMIDKCIHLSTYILPHIGFTAKNRLNAGVGIIGTATTMARKKLKYSEKSGKEELHRMAERHAFYVLKASLQLGKEKGNAPWIHKTKWPEGWLFIDTYKKQVDSIVEPKYNYDWETLRQEIIANGGIRNSSLIAHMPTESSSKASGVPNSIYPIRGLSLKKSDGSNAIDWCAMDSDILGSDYQNAWNISTLDMIDCYSVFQKFADQAISADTYKDRTKDINLSTDDMVKEFLHMVSRGMKSRYYQNSLTSDQNGDLLESDQTVGCDSGACAL